MTSEKVISRKSFSIAIILIGLVIAAVGIVMQVLPHEGLYDLPILLIMIGAIVALFGLRQFFGSKKLGSGISFSGKSVLQFVADKAIILALLVLVVVICFLQPSFMQVRVVFDILTQSSPKLVIALGICFSLIIAGTDLSAGRMVGLSAVIATSMLQTADYGNRFFPDMPQLSIIIPIVAAIFACMLFGLLNGFLVAQFGMHPFIATLAVQTIVYGVCSLYFDMAPNNSQPIGGVRPDFTAIGQTKFFVVPKVFNGVSILIPIAAVICFVIWFILNKTTFGKNVYAIGGNKEAAVVSGVNVYATILFVFIIGSLLYGFGGILEAARTAGATNQYGLGYETDAIAACVVGGVSMTGGVGKISGIITGVLIFTVIQYGLQFVGISPMWQQVIKGIIIAAAVAIDLSKYKKK
ncbi:galactose/methyl galactoside ABC transporter permease MglC [Ruminococcaceae bacterium OttesenSCG-928-A16]|nr:galactose/methyl galactoside ABC transporter permease MglC [Ruminococcaceae bacterium OttesenSCG-928-A16]